MSEIDDLRAKRTRFLEALKSPHSKVATEGNSVEYRSAEDIKSLLAEIDRQIAEAEGRTVGIIRVASSKGLY